jgi:hypothetical protein
MDLFPSSGEWETPTPLGHLVRVTSIYGPVIKISSF